MSENKSTELTETGPGAAVALTIAGSDSGGGAGIQADLKTFSALGVYGCSVITAITAQNTLAVSDVHGVPVATIKSQISAVLDDINVGAIKIGMLSSPDIIETVADSLTAFDGPIVLDPVMVAKSGDALLQDNAVDALREKLIPIASLITPNLPEAARLLNREPLGDEDGMREQGAALLDAGAKAVLMKGGHASGDVCTDILLGETNLKLQSSRVRTRNTHGTGCTLSAAIAALLARGYLIEDAVRSAHEYLQNAIRGADVLRIGSGHGPVHHFHSLWDAVG
ncbi:MAG: bifunctional hydroxymethylpyrimidine kinase/phosphomethylpyrimidine kinase [Pseudomonadota bacterium]